MKRSGRNGHGGASHVRNNSGSGSGIRNSYCVSAPLACLGALVHLLQMGPDLHRGARGYHSGNGLEIWLAILPLVAVYPHPLFEARMLVVTPVHILVLLLL